MYFIYVTKNTFHDFAFSHGLIFVEKKKNYLKLSVCVFNTAVHINKVTISKTFDTL